jgi:hypothetical protein
MPVRPDQLMRMMSVRGVAIRLAMVAVAYVALGAAANAMELITPQEAALPDDLTGMRRGGATRGPEIVFISPAPNAGLVKSPLNLRIRFKSHGGAKIDRDSVLLTYKKIPAIDMTQRLLPFIRADGIDVPNAEVPPGSHRIRIDVKDSDGRANTDYLIVIVGQ